jgi:hypothetical protein
MLYLLDTFRSGRATICVQLLKLQGTTLSLTSFLLNALWVGGTAHSDPVLEEVGSYYMSLNEYAAPSRFPTAMRAGFLGLESFHGNGLTEAALSLDRPPSSPDLTPLDPLNFSGGYIKDAVYLDVRSPLCQNLLGAYEMLRLQLHPPPQKKICVDWTRILTVYVSGYW